VNRRSFFSRASKAVAGAVIAAHMDLGSLVPIQEQIYFPSEPLLSELQDFQIRAIAYALNVPLYRVWVE
jgi:hypothetical protein